ncbi:MAG TPA: fatty acid desaturase, partial [Thermoanaerobaculia bacterium]|nr:fatty acid desaturase [Thermoanaerobaculia bacterium]
MFLTASPLIGVVGTVAYTAWVGFEWWMLALCLTLYFLVGLSVCAGYHRFFSHKSYECARPVQLFYLVFGALAVQSTVLNWSSGHRTHHKHVDHDWDPYNIQRGFWWAHIFWIFYKNDYDLRNVPDLARNPLCRWQQRWYPALLLLGGLGLPAAVGWYFGDVIAGILWGGFLRIVVTHHTTFFVNSLAHSFGERRYDPEVSACDNWLVALLTLGEGYHSFHHRFPADYRNGVRWYHWDPAKWWIWGLEKVGLAERLKRTPEPRIERVRLESSVAQLQGRLDRVSAAAAAEVRDLLRSARHSLECALALRR